jgi:hypothetical protein
MADWLESHMGEGEDVNETDVIETTCGTYIARASRHQLTKRYIDKVEWSNTGVRVAQLVRASDYEFKIVIRRSSVRAAVWTGRFFS